MGSRMRQPPDWAIEFTLLLPTLPRPTFTSLLNIPGALHPKTVQHIVLRFYILDRPRESHWDLLVWHRYRIGGQSEMIYAVQLTWKSPCVLQGFQVTGSEPDLLGYGDSNSSKRT